MFQSKSKRFLCAVLTAAFIFAGCSSEKSVSKHSSDSSDISGSSDISDFPDDDALRDDTQLETNNTSVDSDKKSTKTAATTKATLTNVVTRENKPAKVSIDEYSYPFEISGFESVVSLPDFNDFLQELQDIVKKSDFSLAFAYKNTDTGAEINYNQYQDFMTCSTIKVPYVKSLLENDVNLEQTIKKWSSWTGDSGYTAGLVNGTEISTKELMKRAVSYSDNTAYYLLNSYYGYSQYNANQSRLSNNCYLGPSWIFTHCTAAEMLRNYMDVWEYINTGKHGSFLKEIMSSDDVDVNTQIRSALEPKYTVCEKYGSEFGSWGNENQFHDCAIVYAESPFVLVIFTNQVPETEQSSEIFKKLAVVFYKINAVINTKK